MPKRKIAAHPEWATRHRTPGTELKLIDGKYYLYGVKSMYDKAIKKTRKMSLGIIGRITESGGLIPSDKAQLKVARQSLRISTVADREYGFSCYLHQQAQKAILPALKQHFPESWALILALAYCRMLWQAPIKNIPYHLECASLLQMLDISCPDETQISQELRKIGSQRHQAVQYMQAFAEEGDSVLVDATEIACNSTQIALSQKGYNSDMNFKPQVTLLYAYSAKNHKPFFFRLVAGNIRDVSILKNALIESGIKKSVFVADKGFYSAENIKQLDNLEMHYIIPLRRDNKAIAYDKLDGIDKTPAFCFKFRDRYIFYTTYEYEKKIICLFLDGKLKENEKADYLNRIETVPESHTQSGYSEKVKTIGTIALLHNKGAGEKPEDAYLSYKSRGEIEQFFDCYKNTIDAYVSHMQNEDALRGWMFVNHIAMQLTYDLVELIKQRKLTKWHSTRDVIMHLSQIRRVQINEKDFYITEINKKTKQILSKLKISVT